MFASGFAFVGAPASFLFELFALKEENVVNGFASFVESFALFKNCRNVY
jgi:hypothetical protein